MSVLSLTQFQLPGPGVEAIAEVLFDGRVIGHMFRQNEQFVFEPSMNASKQDLREAEKQTKKLHKLSLAEHLCGITADKTDTESRLIRMRKRLKKSTMFRTPQGNILQIAHPYCEQVRKQIQAKHPGSVILNTLAEEEAFQHYLTLPKKTTTEVAAA